MYCKNCGKPMVDAAVVCVSCGVPRGAGNQFCQNCGQPVMPNAFACTHCGAQVGAAPVQQANPAAKSRICAGLLGLFLGGLGIHNFYLGYTGKAVAQLILTITVLLAPISGIWALIEAIMILTGSIAVDGKGLPLRD